MGNQQNSIKVQNASSYIFLLSSFFFCVTVKAYEKKKKSIFVRSFRIQDIDIFGIGNEFMQIYEVSPLYKKRDFCYIDFGNRLCLIHKYKRMNENAIKNKKGKSCKANKALSIKIFIILLFAIINILNIIQKCLQFFWRQNYLMEFLSNVGIVCYANI